MRATRQTPSGDQRDLFATGPPSLPAGSAYRDDVIAAGEEQGLVERLAALPFKPFEFHGHLGKRRVVSFGWRYDYAGRALLESDPIPAFLLPLREQAALFAGVRADTLQQVLVNEYPPGAGIGWHRDKPMFEDEVAISLLSPSVLRLRRKRGAAWDRASIHLEPRSAYLLRGVSRREWEHSVPPVDRLRYSVTFRNFSADQRAA